MPRPSVLFVRIPAIPADIEADWNVWYDREHIAYRLDKPGFRGARRYRVDEGPVRYFALYELDDPAALTSEPYLAHRRWEEAVPPPRFEALAPRLPGFGRGVYETAWPDDDRYVVPEAEALAVVDFSGTPADTDAGLAQRFVERVTGCDGVIAARVLALSSGLRTGTGRHTPGPTRIAMVDVSGTAAQPDRFMCALADAANASQLGEPRLWMLGKRLYSSFSKKAQ